jgi:hypothetical protein
MATVTEYAEGLKEELAAPGNPVPGEVKKKVQAAERAIAGDETKWQEVLAFLGNDQYVFVNAVSNQLDRLDVREGGSKPVGRSRLTRNRMSMQVMNEASFIAGRPPEYEVVSPNQDPNRKEEARMGEMALRSLFEQIALDRKTIDALIYAMGTGAGFTWPYWDPKAGDWVGQIDDASDGLFLGGIKVPVLHQGEVLWQQGMSFEDSPWHCVRKAQPIEYVKKLYPNVPRLSGDAKAGMWERVGNEQGSLVFVYNFLEPPCEEYRSGRWITYAGDQQLREERKYPRPNGEKVIHELPWIPQPNRHRHLGAGELMLDVQRTWNRTINQIVAWKNLVLLPQLMAPVGSILTPPSDVPGSVVVYRPIAGKVPEWREVPEIPESLFKMLELCLSDFEHILSFEELPAGVDSGSGVDSMQQRRTSASRAFSTGLARWHASMGYHLLELIAQHWTEPRLLEVQGRFGVDKIPQFNNQKIGKPGRVRVSVSSVEPRTKASMEARLMGYAERGWILPHQAMAAISGGTAEQLITDFELDIARQYREIEALEALAGWKPDPAFQRALELYELSYDGTPDGLPQHLQEQLPSLPMAEDYDDHKVHIDVLRQWMKTHEFELAPSLVKQAARNHLAQHQMMQDVEFMKEAQRAQAKAESLGVGNAQRDPGMKASPSPASQETLAGKAQQPRGE